ncbi:MAG: hypothetical protein ACREET_05965 [Stellaceae bacterium]
MSATTAKELSLSGRLDNVVYEIHTTTGAVKKSASATSRTPSPYGRNPAATPWATPAIWAERHLQKPPPSEG